MSNENKTNETVEKKKKYSVDIEPINFNAQAKCLYISTIDLCDMIGSIFKPVLPDFSGSKIRVKQSADNANLALRMIPDGEFYVELYFKPNSPDPDPETSNVVLRNRAVGSDLLSRAQALVGASTSRLYDLTDWTKEVLIDFTHFYAPDLDYKRFNAYWNDRIIERPVQMNSMLGTPQQTLVSVTGLPLKTFIYYMYGEKIEDEETGAVSEYDYDIQYKRNVVSPQTMYGTNPNANGEYILQISQMNRNIQSDLARSIGFGFQSNYEYNVYK